MYISYGKYKRNENEGHKGKIWELDTKTVKRMKTNKSEQGLLEK